MKASTIFTMVRSGKAHIFSSINLLLKPWYRTCFLAAAGKSGLLSFLAEAPRETAEIAVHLGIAKERVEPLLAWLDAGVAIGILKRSDSGYALKRILGKALARPRHDDLLALIIEMATLHYTLLMETPQRLKEGRLFTLADQDGELIARSSRSIEPLVQEAISRVVPKSGELRLLEIGCGSGTYVRYAASLNPSLTALALELQDDVAEMARKNLAEWRLSERVTVEVGDILHREGKPTFHLATLHNNIYYFPVDQRVKLLAHVRRFLCPGGRIVLTTGCLGGSAMMQVLNLWGAVTEGCGPLPAPEELCQQLVEAGYIDVKTRNLASPVERFNTFMGVNPG